MREVRSQSSLEISRNHKEYARAGRDGAGRVWCSADLLRVQEPGTRWNKHAVRSSASSVTRRVPNVFIPGCVATASVFRAFFVRNHSHEENVLGGHSSSGSGSGS